MNRLIPKNTSRVAVVIPLSKRKKMTASENISFQNARHFLGEFDTYFAVPECNSIKTTGDINLVKFPDVYFGSKEAYNYLMLSNAFYNRFDRYDYILIYHLDSLVFSNQLLKWCDSGFDYIGSPWIFGPDLPWLKAESVGNGGFSLRKVQSFQELLQSDKRWRTLNKKLNEIVDSGTFSKKVLKSFWAPLHRYLFQNHIQNHIVEYINNQEYGYEDRFISCFANKYHPDFKIPSVQTALKFGFEANPRICFERNNKELPFGCHAWEKYDKQFWMSQLKKRETMSGNYVMLHGN